MNAPGPSLSSLEAAERQARRRLEVFRAKVYAGDRASAIADQRRLNELERAWRFAAGRLRDARSRRTAPDD